MRVWVDIVSWGMVWGSKVGERGGEGGMMVEVIVCWMFCFCFVTLFSREKMGGRGLRVGRLSLLV